MSLWQELERRNVRGRLVAALLVLAALPAHAQNAARFADVPRVVAVADVHGAYDALTDLLEATGIVDAELGWSGGQAHLVSLGDLVDRGPDSRAVMDLLMRLQSEAEAAGGRVHVVLGNHEVMNLTGDLRYVSAAEYAAFADAEPAALRADAFERFAAEAGGLGRAELEAEFARRYPGGYFGHRAAFAPEGRYGAWLLTLPAIVVVNETAFVHGGLPELVAREGLRVNDEIRQRLRGYLAGRIELEDAPALGVDGPLWYRGSVYCNELLERPVLNAALDALGATSAVVGHTPTADRRVRALHGGSLVMLDTGMLSEYYGGRPAALILEGGEPRVQYLAPAERGEVVPGALLAHGLTEAELLERLARARVEAAEADGAGTVTLAGEGGPIEARFYPERGGAASRELAAYSLDRLLGLDLVPPTVAREVDGDPGAVQLVFPDGVSEAERLERRLPFGWCPVPPQAQLMYVFDLLTMNAGRTQQTLRYRNDLSNLVLIDHGAAFGTAASLPGSLNVELALPPTLVEALSAVDDAVLEARLGEWLSGRRIRALLARRDALLERAAAAGP